MELTATEAAILALLAYGKRSGYEVSKAIEQSVGFFWNPAKSQLYAVLPRLVDRGFATVRRVRQEDRPDKQVYAITRAGRKAVEQWLADPDFEPDPARHPFLLKLFFAGLAGEGTAHALLEERRRRKGEFVAQLEAIEARVRGDDANFYGYLTLTFGLERARATLRWTKRALKLVEERTAARVSS